MENFDPGAAFTWQLREPLIRSFIFAWIAVVGLGTVAFTLMTRPTPEQLLGYHLQKLANSVPDAPGTAQQQLAAAARDVGRDLANPMLPPQEKIAELHSLKRELEKLQPQRQAASSGRGNSSGNGNSGGTGQGRGSNSGNGLGKGSGSGNSPNGDGATQGGKSNQQIAELRNDLAKAQMRLEQESESRTSTSRNDSSKGNGVAPKPGSNTNQTGGQNPTTGSGLLQQPQTLASAQMPSGQNSGSKQNNRGSMGDTHLGDFPKPGNYDRFYKLGEHGPGMNIRDARYVTFQLPTEIDAAGAGTTVSDNTRPRATTPYTNAPLKSERLPSSPDEQQLVPPRYRELIR